MVKNVQEFVHNFDKQNLLALAIIFVQFYLNSILTDDIAEQIRVDDLTH